MVAPGTALVDAVVRAADRSGADRGGSGGCPGGVDPLLDALCEPVEVPGGPVCLLRPRDPDALPFETVSAPDSPIEELHPAHWARLWPSGTALARAIDTAVASPVVAVASPVVSDRAGRDESGSHGAPREGIAGDRCGRPRAAWAGMIVVRGRSVLELGCGLGLPSLTAARAGGRVLATDRSLAAATYVAATATHEGIDLRSAACTWDAAQPLVEERSAGGARSTPTARRCRACCCTACAAPSTRAGPDDPRHPAGRARRVYRDHGPREPPGAA